MASGCSLATIRPSAVLPAWTERAIRSCLRMLSLPVLGILAAFGLFEDRHALGVVDQLRVGARRVISDQVIPFARQVADQLVRQPVDRMRGAALLGVLGVFR